MFKQGNEHLFKEIRRKIAPCANGPADKDPAARVPPDGSGGDGQAMLQLQSDFDELRHKHTQMEAKLHDKDSEQRYLVARMLQDQEEHQALGVGDHLDVSGKRRSSVMRAHGGENDAV